MKLLYGEQLNSHFPLGIKGVLALAAHGRLIILSLFCPLTWSTIVNYPLYLYPFITLLTLNIGTIQC